VANVLVSRGGDDPRIWATYSDALGSPVGTSMGGQFRFSCSGDQNCAVSIAAAELSGQTGTAFVYARVLIYKSVVGGPETTCEYADGSTNNGTPAKINLEPLDTRAIAINDPLPMGIGGSLDCGSTQKYAPVVREIEVPPGAFYDVWASFNFK
jgi:hypothetical protein